MKFDNNNLKVNFIAPITTISPIENRKYTLTHSDTSGLLFLDIANFYNYDVVNFKIRDEVLGEWIPSGKNHYILCLYIYLKGIDPSEICRKYKIFKSHLDLSINAILHGDIQLINENKYLLSSPIHVKFSSSHFMFNSIEYYETPSYYLK